LKVGHIIILSMLILPKQLFGQGARVGEWRIHMPYSNCNYLAESDDRIYVTSEFGFFAFDKKEKQMERLSTINGFSEVDAKVLAYDPETQKTWIGYANSKIDVVHKRRIKSLTDIFRSSISGDKSINHISFHSNRAYVSTGLGIIVYNQDRLEVVENYLNLGQTGNDINLPIYSTAVLGDTIFAAAGSKIIYGLLRNNINLQDYSNWNVFTTSTSSHHLVAFNGLLYAELDSITQVWNGSAWQVLYDNSWGELASIKKSNNHLVITLDRLIRIIRPDNSFHEMLRNGARQGIVDSENSFWRTSSQFGLLLTTQDSGSVGFYPNGPNTPTSFKMINHNGGFWVTAGGHNHEYVHNYNFWGYNIFKDNRWIENPYRTTELARIHDFTGVAKHPTENRLFISTHGKGIIEFEGDKPVNVFRHQNSAIRFFDNNAGDSMYYTTGIAYDKQGNLWVTNYAMDSALHVYTKDKVWKSFRLPTIYTGELIIDNNGYKWVITPNPNFSNAAICVFDDRGTPLDGSDDRAQLLNSQNTELPSNLIRSIALTANNEIWVGTDAGLVVFRNPRNVFADNPNQTFKADRIIIEQDGVGGYLLGSEIIYSLQIDGAGRIWAGTNKGAWLIARNGTDILRHYNAQNSPLPTDNVYSIGVDEVTGDVFFGTDKGLFSVKGDAVKPEAQMDKLKIFPNPVRPNFDGEVAIEGLAIDARVKITDINGQVVYETISNGGRATWNCRTFAGIRPATGVYLVFAISGDGEQTGMGKILFVK
jgi:hypothetical protein